MITDKIDGDLARKHDLVTNFGKIADPIADKAITGMAFIGLCDHRRLHARLAVVDDHGRGAGPRVGGHHRAALDRPRRGDAGQAERQGQDHPQALALGGFVAPFGLLTGSLAWLGDLVWWISAATMLVAVVLTLTSGAEFARDVAKDRAERRTATAS